MHSWPLELSRTRKFMRKQIIRLNVRIVAGGALNILLMQPHLGVSGLAVLTDRGDQIGGVLQRQSQAERMRSLQIRAEVVLGIHRSAHGDFAEEDGIAGGDGAIVTAQAKAALASQRRLGIVVVLPVVLVYVV